MGFDSKREWSVLIALGALLAALAFVAPRFFSPENLRDLLLANVPVLMAAIGMTAVILTGEIDVSIGSQFAILSVAAGLLAKTGMPILVLAAILAVFGLILGAINGLLVATAGIPSIVATLATMIIFREALRWATAGAWVENLPAKFQWFGLTQAAGQIAIVIVAAAIFIAGAWLLANVGAGRALYATGSDKEAARLCGIKTKLVLFWAFAIMGAFAALAALLSGVRFRDIQSNSGIGLELKTIAAVVVGGASITGGRGTLAGTLAGVALLGVIGPALTFLGINAYWEKAVQGAIILAAVLVDSLASRRRRDDGASAAA